MKYFIIAGEASGDLHAANLMKAILKKDPSAEFAFLGGDLMKAAVGQQPLIHYKQMAFMGFIDVLKNFKTIYKNFNLTKKALNDFNPDSVILVDYPGFNLKIAAYAKKKGFKTTYYISPKLWAWKEGRVKKIKKYVDQLLVILPFEIKFYKKHNINATYVGNPVVDAVQNHQGILRDQFLKNNHLDKRPIIALLPGSRQQEIKMMLPQMLAIIDKFPDYQFVISGAPSFQPENYNIWLKNYPKIPVIFNQTYDLLQHSHSAIVTSGTATLETALFKTPQVVVYKTQNWQYAIGKHFVKIDYFSLPNLIMQRAIIPELLQHDFNTDRLTEELKKLNSGSERQQCLKAYEDLENVLGKEPVSERAAGEIMHFLNQKKPAY